MMPRSTLNLQGNCVSATWTFLAEALAPNTLQGILRESKRPQGHVKHTGKQHFASLALLELARARGTHHEEPTNRKDPEKSAERAGKQHSAPHAFLGLTRTEGTFQWILRNTRNPAAPRRMQFPCMFQAFVGILWFPEDHVKHFSYPCGIHARQRCRMLFSCTYVMILLGFLRIP